MLDRCVLSLRVSESQWWSDTTSKFSFRRELGSADNIRCIARDSSLCISLYAVESEVLCLDLSSHGVIQEIAILK